MKNNNYEHYYNAVAFIHNLSNIPLEDEYLIDTHHAGIYLKRMRYFLNLIGNPDRDLKFIHITGTAGKGSVTAMIHNSIHASGKRVGSFTSPFVTTPIEKIKVGEKYIDPTEFAHIVDYLKPHLDRAYREGPYGRPSVFELFLAMALLYFKKKKCEWVVLEVGLGGRYDATNVIEHPVVTAITNIDYDHTELLGKTLKKIGYDKAGIIKKGSVFFTTEERAALLTLFKRICDEHTVVMHQLHQEENYQNYNVALATAIAKHIGIKDTDIKEGIRSTQLPCRFEMIQENPRVILDGAHNRSKIKSTVDNLKKLTYKKLHVVIGIAEDKDSKVILEQIIPLADTVAFTRFQVPDRICTGPKELMNLSKEYLKQTTRVEMFLDSEQALTSALKRAHKNDIVLVAGSFYLAGELRKRWFPEEWVLKNRRSF